MAKEPKMKIGIGSDTGDFDKGARKVKQEMKDLNKVSSDTFAAIGAAIGVDTGKLGQFSSALQGLGHKFTQMGTEGAKSFGSILSAIGPVAAGLAGLGIAATAAAFKSLKEEADAFKQSVNGINIEMATAAYIETYRDVLHDMNSAQGKAMAEAESNWKKFWGTLGANARQYFKSGAFGEALMAGEGGRITGEGMESYRAAVAAATQGAEYAEQISSRITELNTQRVKNISELAALNNELSAAMLQVREAITDKDVKTASDALVTAKQKINEIAAKQLPIEEEIAKLLREQADITSENNTRLDVIQKAEEAEARVSNIQKAQSDQLGSLERMQRTVNSLAAANAKEREAAATAAKLEADNIARIAALQANPIQPIKSNLIGQVQAPVELILPREKINEFKEHWVMELGGGLTLAIAIDPDSTQKIHDITNEIQSAVEALAASVGESIGALVGALISGEDPWQAFANSALSAIGDMAVSVGKMAVATGVATLGIKAALESLNGYVAIAAGVALIALGTAVKSGLAGIASGNYSAGANVATSNATAGYSADYEQREVTVNVTGTLVADGDQLVATINNANKKSFYQT